MAAVTLLDPLDLVVLTRVRTPVPDHVLPSSPTHLERRLGYPSQIRRFVPVGPVHSPATSDPLPRLIPTPN